MTKLTTAELDFNGYTSVLLRYENGEPALWVEDRYIAGQADAPGSYTLNDVNTGVPLGPTDDINVDIAAWKVAVGWGAS